jgi:hypothetical protein
MKYIIRFIDFNFIVHGRSNASCGTWPFTDRAKSPIQWLQKKDFLSFQSLPASELI